MRNIPREMSHEELMSRFGDPYKGLIASVILSGMYDRDTEFVESDRLDSWVEKYNCGLPEKKQIPAEAWRKNIKKKWKEDKIKKTHHYNIANRWGKHVGVAE